MKNCIEKIKCGELVVIGVRDFQGCTEPLSDLFINNIPGIGLKTMAAMISPEQESGAKVLKEKIIDATLFAINDFKKVIQPVFNFNHIVESGNECEYSKGASFFWPLTALNRGVKISRVEEPLAKIQIKRLFIRVKQGGPTVIKIEDKNEVFEYNVDLVEGINVLNLNKKFEHDEIFVTMDNTNFEVSQGFCFNTCNGCGSGEIRSMIVEGWNGTSVDNYLYGINVEAILVCDHEELLCLALEQLYYPIYYKSASLIFDEMAKTPRLNNVANSINKEIAKEASEEYELKYLDDYKSTAKSLNKFLSSFRGECITCKGNRYATELP